MHILDSFGHIYARWHRIVDQSLRIGTVNADATVTLNSVGLSGARGLLRQIQLASNVSMRYFAAEDVPSSLSGVAVHIL